MSILLSNDQVDLITKKFLTLTSKDLNVAGDDTIRYVTGRFGLTKIRLKATWQECEVTIEHVQGDEVHGLLYQSECPFNLLKWLINRNYRNWTRIKNHVVKVVDQQTKDL